MVHRSMPMSYDNLGTGLKRLLQVVAGGSHRLLEPESSCQISRDGCRQGTPCAVGVTGVYRLPGIYHHVVSRHLESVGLVCPSPMTAFDEQGLATHGQDAACSFVSIGIVGDGHAGQSLRLGQVGREQGSPWHQ